MKKDQTVAELIETLENRIATGDYNDSVHKIKLMTTLQTVQRMLNSE